MPYINNTKRKIKYIIAPHEISDNPQRIKKELGSKSILFSEIESKTNLKEFPCLIIDNIGMLSYIYSYSTIAYVGGGMGRKGLHNTLEPAYFSKPIIIGRNYKNFKEAAEMIENGNIKSISNYDELSYTVKSIIDDKNLQQEMSEKCKAYFNKNKGAIKIILKSLK